MTTHASLAFALGAGVLGGTSNVLADGTLWSHAATLGEFVKGSSFTLDADAARSMAANFASGYPQKLPVDYEHETADKRVAGTTQVPWTRKAGDIIDVLAVLDPGAERRACGSRSTDERARRAAARRRARQRTRCNPLGLWIRWLPTRARAQLVREGASSPRCR
jgi:hypothetical protein